MLSRRMLNRTVGRMRENSPHRCFNCFPCAQNSERPCAGTAMQKEDLIHLPVWPFYFTSYVLNMFRTLKYPSSVACDFAVELPHRLFSSRFVVCWRFGAAADCRLKAEPQLVVLQPSTCSLQPHQSSKTQRTEKKTTDVVIQQQSRKLPITDILMSETCSAHKK